MRLKKIFLIILVLLYLSGIWIWASPMKKNKLPFGDVDSTAHFTIGDTIYLSDKPIYWLPYDLNTTYGLNAGGRIWYPPQFHMNVAAAELLGGERVVPAYIFFLIASTAVMAVIMFVMFKLFGFWPAALSGFLLIFSMRDVLYYIWGIWPNSFSFAFIAVILYSYYKYIQSHNRPVYIYILALLLASQFFMHPTGAVHSVAALSVFTIVCWIKFKKMPFKAKHAVVAALIFLIIIGYFLQFPLAFNKSKNVMGTPGKNMDITRLFSWYPDFEPYRGSMPESFLSYSEMNGLWTFPLLLLGIIFLSIRRKLKDLLLLSWLLSFALLVHRNVIGMIPRIHRDFPVEGHIFYPLAAIGLISILSYISLPKKQKGYAKAVLIALFVIFTLYINAKPAHSTLSGAYHGLGRLTPNQYEAAEWMLENLPEDAHIMNVGTMVYAKKKWMWAASHRFQIYGNEIIPINNKYFGTQTHVLVDYSDAMYTNNQQLLAYLTQWEAQNLENSTLLYNKNNVKVYKLG